MRTGLSIIVENIGSDPIFGGWAAEWHSEVSGTSVESLVVVPLGPGPDSIGA